MNDNFSQNIIKQIDKGIPIYDIAEYFGGLDKFRKLILKYPYLVALVETKLGGYISIEVDGEEYETYEIPFILIHFSETDFDEKLYNASVDIQIPEITNKEDLKKILFWIDNYSGDNGSEFARFNDRKLNDLEIWVSPGQINGLSWGSFPKFDEVPSDKEVEKVIPKEYKV